MNNLFKYLKEYLPVFYVLLFFGLIIGLFFLFCYIPHMYDFFKGDKILDAHIKEVIGNETDHAKIAGLLMEWLQENVVYPRQEDKISIVGINFYNINGKKRFFWRDVPASWTIIKKIGMCGEDANYFVEIMNRLGYKSRKIRPEGWDHTWAEYYTLEGKKIVLDPSSNQIITDLQKWIEGKNVTKVEAIDLKGKKEDITLEYT